MMRDIRMIGVATPLLWYIQCDNSFDRVRYMAANVNYPVKVTYN